jgi:hypothetical protein
MDVPGLVWALTILGILALLLFDFCFQLRTAHTQAAIWSGAYMGSAVFLATTWAATDDLDPVGGAAARLGAPGRATSPRGTWSRGARVRNG